VAPTLFSLSSGIQRNTETGSHLSDTTAVSGHSLRKAPRSASGSRTFAERPL
jgi:hypothetical protein